MKNEDIMNKNSHATSGNHNYRFSGNHDAGMPDVVSWSHTAHPLNIGFSLLY